MKLHWQPHHLLPRDLSHAHHNGYSILWAKTPKGRLTLGGALFEVMPGDDDVSRFNKRSDMWEHIK